MQLKFAREVKDKCGDVLNVMQGIWIQQGIVIDAD